MHYIDQFRQRENPFYFQINFWGPHEPYVATTKHLDLYRDLDLEPWQNYNDPSTNKPAIHHLKRAKSADWKTFEPFVKHYFASISLIDEQIGRLIDYLKKHDLYDDTIIVFFSRSWGIFGDSWWFV